jgi:5-methylcytosine-specific restriction endonuclease McrA
LGIVATDGTFERTEIRGDSVWLGRCLHCNTRVVVAMTGVPDAGVTIEHIVPRHHGGTDDLANLALACARCNQSKGARLDHRDWQDPRLQEVVAQLVAKRRARWREPT